MSDNIQVAIRVRQLIEKECQSGYKSNWTINGQSISCNDEAYGGRKPPVYTFDYIFDETTVTLDLFNETCKPIVDASLNGFNGTIFAYGQSSSGKTHTMTGSAFQPGIIPLSVDEIFDQIENIPDREYLLRVSYMEIYNEKLTDLLKEDDTNLKLQEDTDKTIKIVGIHEEMVHNRQVVTNVMKKGNAKRHTAATKQNDRSSRSHCILRFVIESRVIGEEEEAVKVSNLYFVDLAGSEKAHDNVGDRFREGCSINRSLFTLGNVIRKLSGDDNFQHTSYRDSKLTRVLQNALGGNSKTAIICTMTPAHVEESESTLKFASRAKTITNAAHVNEVMSDAALLKKYQRMVKSLEKKVSEGTDGQLVKQLQEHAASLNEQAETIKNLKKMILISGTGEGTGEPVAKKRRRETWAPGKRHGKPRLSLPGASNFTIPQFGMDEPIIEEEEQPADLVEAEQNETIDVFKHSPPSMNDLTIDSNPTLKELFQLQDAHELLKEELQRKDEELNGLREFEEMERQAQEETVNELSAKLKDWENSQQWMEEELMKAQQERNSLRQKVDTMTRQVKSAEQGTGLTEKCEELADAQRNIDQLNSDIDVQKSRYEFHIEQMKQKLESMTGLLEQQGIDSEVIKQRLGSETELGTEMAELKSTHESKVNDLQNEIDMLVLSLEREQAKMKGIDEQFAEAMEEQKRIFTKDIQERDEEIKIYIDLFEKESGPPPEERKAMQGEVIALRERLQKQKEDYEEKISLLRADLDKHGKSSENTSTDGTNLAGDHQDLAYQQEIESLKAEVEQLNNIREQVEIDWKQKYECLLEERQESSNKVEPQNSLMEAELENLKTLYEEELNALRVKNDSLMAKLRRRSSNYYTPMNDTNGSSLNTEIIDKYEADIEKLTQQLEQERNKPVTSEPEHLESNSQLVETLKQQMEEMKTEYEERLLTQKESFVKVGESEESIKAEGVDSPVDLGSELLAAQLEEVKVNAEKQIQDLKDMYEQKLNEAGEQEMSNGVVETDIESLKEDHEKKMKDVIHHYEEQIRLMNIQETATPDVAVDVIKTEMEEMRQSYEGKILELTLNKPSSDPTDCLNDLQSELLKADMVEMKEKYELQLEELNAKYEGLLAENECKLDNKTECSDNLRYELLEEEMAKMRSSYEEKLSELNEKLLASSKKLDDVNDQICENEVDLHTKESLKRELEEMKEGYELRLVELTKKYETLSADYALKCEHDTSVNVADLRQEMLVSEMGNVADLRQEMLAAETKNGTDLKQEMLVAEMENATDLRQEMLAAEMETSTDLRQEMLNAETENPTDLRQEMLAAETKNVSDLDPEILSVEIDKMRTAHQEEINELNERLRELASQVDSGAARDEPVEDQATPPSDGLYSDQVDQSAADPDPCIPCCKERETFNERCRMYESTIKEIGEELAGFKQSIKKLSEDIELLQAANKSLKTEKIELINKNSDLQEKLDVCTEVVDELKVSLKVTEDDNEALRSSVTDNSDLKGRISVLEQEKGLHTDLVTEYEQQIKEITDQLDLERNKAKLVEQYDAEIKELTDRLNTELEKNELLKEYELQVKDLEEKLDLEAGKGELLQEYELQLKELKERLNSESADSELIAEYESKIRELSEEKSNSEMQRQESIEKHRLQIEELSEKLKSLEHNEELVLQYELKIKELSDKLDLETTNSERIVEFELYVKELSDELDSEKSKSEQIPDLENQIKELTEKFSEKTVDPELIAVYDQQIKELTEQLVNETANSELIAEYESQIKELTEKLNCETANSELITEYDQQIKELTEKLNGETANSELIIEYESQIKELTEKLNCETANSELITEYESQIKELNEKLNCETANSELITEYESQIKELNERLAVESANSDLLSANSDLISEYESHIKELTTDNEELQASLRNVEDEKEGEIKLLKDQLEATNGSERDIDDALSSFKNENSELLQKVEDLEGKISEKEKLIEDLEEDKWMLEKNLPPESIKYHSLPENVDWENKWELFVRQERLKRRAVKSEILHLRAENAKLEAGKQATVEDAIENLRLTDETIRLQTVVAKLEEQLKEKTTNSGYVADPDHCCKYRQDNLKTLTDLDQVKGELQSYKKSLEEVTQNYEQRISKLKNEIRRLGDLDKTFDASRFKQPSFMEEKPKEKPLCTPTPDTSVGYGSSTSGGIVDFYKVCLLEADNKELKKELERLKKKLAHPDTLSKENTHTNKDSFVKQVEEPVKERHALGDVSRKPPTSKSTDQSSDLFRKDDQIDEQKKEESKFDLSFLREKPKEHVRVEKKKKDILDENPDNCKTS